MYDVRSRSVQRAFVYLARYTRFLRLYPRTSIEEIREKVSVHNEEMSLELADERGEPPLICDAR